MIKPFEAVLKSLDERGQVQFGDKWMKKVERKLVALEDSYKVLSHVGREPISYGELPTQAAYVFAYGMPRAYYTDEFLRRHRVSLGVPLFNNGELKVVSFGGGPASELVGLLNYLNDDQQGEGVTKVVHKVYDKDGEWKEAGETLAASSKFSVGAKVDYVRLDLADDVATKQVDLDGADFVIFSSIMSELCALDGSQAISANVNRILGTMRSGTRILFVDNLWTDCIKYFKTCKGYNGLEKNEDVKPVHFELPNWPPTFASFAAALGRLPRMGSDKMISKWYIKS